MELPISHPIFQLQLCVPQLRGGHGNHRKVWQQRQLWIAALTNQRQAKHPPRSEASEQNVAMFLPENCATQGDRHTMDSWTFLCHPVPDTAPPAGPQAELGPSWGHPACLESPFPVQIQRGRGTDPKPVPILPLRDLRAATISWNTLRRRCCFLPLSWGGFGRYLCHEKQKPRQLWERGIKDLTCVYRACWSLVYLAFLLS